MPKRGLGTQVAVFAVVAVCAVATIGVVSLTRPVIQPGAAPGSGTSTGGAAQATYLYRTMPKEFTVGAYRFYMGYNGTGYGYAVNGTAVVNLGFTLKLIASNGSTNQTAVFGWEPPGPQRGTLPVPNSATLFGGALQLGWATNSTGTYLSVYLGRTASISETSTEPMTTTTSSSERNTSSFTVTTITLTTSTTQRCVITGQANAFELRVLWDSNQTPVAGAQVQATTEPDSVNGQPCGQPQTRSFTTAGQEWYSFDAYNVGGYSISVSFAGQSYTLNAGLSPLSATCASLYLPSGRTNVTAYFLSTSCP